jgi:hypothetical protein
LVLATRLPEFGPTDPFESRLTGETVGNLVPDDYYRFTLSRNGRVTAELVKLLADADLVLYDARDRPIAWSMREGITDEQIIADLIPGTYMLRVNSPKGVTTDYDLIVKFKHKLSQTELGPLRVGKSVVVAALVVLVVLVVSLVLPSQIHGLIRFIQLLLTNLLLLSGLKPMQKFEI